MKLHCLVAERRLLWPKPIAHEDLCALTDAPVAVPTAFWISRRCGRTYHDFLCAAEDDRTTAFAAALRDNFGARFKPLIVLSDLDGGEAPAIEVLEALLHAMGPTPMRCLRVVLDPALDPADEPPGPSDRHAGLRRRLERCASGVEWRELRVDADTPGCAAFAFNATINAIASGTTVRLTPLEVDEAALTSWLEEWVDGMIARGLRLTSRLSPAAIDRLADAAADAFTRRLGLG